MSIIITERPPWDNKFHSGLGSYFYMFSSDRNDGRITRPWFRTIQSSSGVCISRKSGLSKTLNLDNIIPLAQLEKVLQKTRILRKHTLAFYSKVDRLTGNGCLLFFPKYFYFQCHFLRTTTPAVFSFIWNMMLIHEGQIKDFSIRKDFHREYLLAAVVRTIVHGHRTEWGKAC